MNQTVLKPMKLTDVSLTTVGDYLNDPEWVLEQKHDGARAFVIVRRLQVGEPLTFEWLASGGGPLKFAAAVQHFKTLEAAIDEMLPSTVLTAVLDGELMTDDGTYRLFDAPILVLNTDEGGLTQVISAGMPYWARRNGLHRIVGEPEGPVVLTQIAHDADSKARLWEQINLAGVEGAVAKHVESVYEYGGRSKQQVKLKLVKSADVVVGKISNWTHRTGTAELYVHIDPSEDPRPFVNAKGKRASERELPSTVDAINKSGWVLEPRSTLVIGNSSLIGKDKRIEVGSVVEIEYLYWTGDAVVQPRITRFRRPEEKVAIECGLAQFPAYSRVAVG